MVACLLTALRLYLAVIVKEVVNRRLARMSGYSGHIDGVGLSLWRGAYQIEGLKIVKKNGQVPVPFFLSPHIDLGLQWKALFRGRLVARVTVTRGELNFVNGPSPAQRQSGKGEPWKELLESLVPVKINYFRLIQSAVHFRDPYGKPPVDVHMDGLDLVAENLSSRRQGDAAKLGSVTASARVMREGRMNLRMRFNPFAPAPTFDYGITMKGLDLVDLNPLLLRYVGFDVHRGTVDLYSEAAATEGKFKGYFKPMVTDLKVMKPREDLTLGQWIKKALAGMVGWIFKNDKQQVATIFQFSGEFRKPDTDLWHAAWFLFENAFIEALPSSLEGAVRVEDLKKEPLPVKP